MKYIKIIGTVLFTIGVGLLFLGLRVKNHNLFLLVIGGILGLVGFVLVILMAKKEDNTMLNEYILWKENLINNGIRTEVNLNKVEIKSNFYTEKKFDEGYSKMNEYKLLNSLVKDNNPEYVDFNGSVLVYETDVLGKSRIFYSPIIRKDKITLQFLLSNQKKTFVYSDKLNENNYYFDIEFLDE